MHPRSLRILTLASTAALLVAGCQKKAVEKAPPEKAAVAEKPASQPAKVDKRSLHKHMQEHFVKADNLKDAVIAGQFDLARILAKWMAEHDAPADLPKTYAPHAERVRAAAQEIVDGEGASAVAHGAATLAAACAKCHAARDKKIEFGADPEPEGGKDLTKAHMARQAWAVTRMWDGVVGGSDALYTSGAKVLSELPLLAISLKDGNALTGAAADKMVDQLKTSAEKAGQAATPEARAEALGAALSSCANCHAMLDKGPK